VRSGWFGASWSAGLLSTRAMLKSGGRAENRDHARGACGLRSNDRQSLPVDLKKDEINSADYTRAN
jgi:hypothetical protein